MKSKGYFKSTGGNLDLERFSSTFYPDKTSAEDEQEDIKISENLPDNLKQDLIVQRLRITEKKLG